MNIRNPFSGYGFRIDPDNLQDRKSGETITRKMTPEEIEKYGCAVKSENKQSDIAAVPSMVGKGVEMTKIDKERLIEICEEYGFTAEAYRTAAKEFNVSTHSIANFVSNNKLKKAVIPQKSGNETNLSEIDIPEEVKKQDEAKTDVSNDEMEIISKIKSILQENRSLSGENKTLKDNMSKVKAALEDILKSIA